MTKRKTLREKSRKPDSSTLPITLELLGDDVAVVGEHKVQANAPIMEMCDLLVKCGVNPLRPVHVYRDGKHVLSSSEIGRVASLRVSTSATGTPIFLKAPKR